MTDRNDNNNVATVVVGGPDREEESSLFPHPRRPLLDQQLTS